MTHPISTMSDVYTRVGKLLLDEDNEAYTQTEMDEDWYDAELQFNQETMFFTKRDITSVSTAADTIFQTLPTDFMFARRVKLINGSSELITLTESTLDKINMMNSGWETDDTDTPCKYFIEGDQIGFQPVPDATYVVHIWYVYAPDYSTIPNIPPYAMAPFVKYLLSRGLWKRAEVDRDFRKYESMFLEFSRDFKRAVKIAKNTKGPKRIVDSMFVRYKGLT